MSRYLPVSTMLALICTTTWAGDLLTTRMECSMAAESLRQNDAAWTLSSALFDTEGYRGMPPEQLQQRFDEIRAEWRIKGKNQIERVAYVLAKFNSEACSSIHHQAMLNISDLDMGKAVMLTR